MLSVPDLAILGTVALLLFGPDRLPGVARKFGQVMREVQNTSQTFLREMERAADEHEARQEAERSRLLHDDPVSSFPEFPGASLELTTPTASEPAKTAHEAATLESTAPSVGAARAAATGSDASRGAHEGATAVSASLRGEPRRAAADGDHALPE